MSYGHIPGFDVPLGEIEGGRERPPFLLPGSGTAALRKSHLPNTPWGGRSRPNYPLQEGPEEDLQGRETGENGRSSARIGRKSPLNPKVLLSGVSGLPVRIQEKRRLRPPWALAPA